MTYEQYLEKKSAIEKEKNSLIRQLGKEYALNNNSYKIGDTISDRFGSTILIEKIELSYNWGKPCCAYFGTKLRKNGTPYKSGEKDWVHQTNAIEK
jgi:hypothetical protein